MRRHAVWTNFSDGQVSSYTHGQLERSNARAGCKKIQNMIPIPQGGVRTRPGTLHINLALPGAERLIEKKITEAEQYVFEFAPGVLRIHDAATRAVMQTLDSPWTKVDDSWNLEYIDFGSSMFFSHPDYPPQILRQNSPTSFQLEPFRLLSPPTWEADNPGPSTITWAASTGTDVEFTVTSPLWLGGDIGRGIRAGGGVARITKVIDMLRVECTILDPFPEAPNNSAPAGGWVIDGSPSSSVRLDYVTDDSSGGDFPVTVQPVADGVVVIIEFYQDPENGVRQPTFRANDVGMVILWHDGAFEITEVGATGNSVRAIVHRLPDSFGKDEQDTNWTLEQPVWTRTNGYPRTVSVFDERLFFGGSRLFPTTIWGSAVGVFEDFTRGSRDDDPVEFRLTSRRLSQMQWMADLNELVIGTASAEKSVSGGPNKPITPANRKARTNSNFGSARVRPEIVGNQIFFVPRNRRKIRRMGFDTLGEAYLSPDISAKLWDIFNLSPVRDMTLSEDPWQILWFIQDNGTMLSYTYNLEEQVAAFAVHDFPNPDRTKAKPLSLCTVDPFDYSQTWVLLDRTVGGETTRRLEMLDYSRHADASVKGSATGGTRTIGGLGHLEGETLNGVINGTAVVRGLKVEGGQIRTPILAYDWHFGIHFVQTLQPFYVEAIAPEIASFSKTWGYLNMRLLDSVPPAVNGNTQELRVPEDLMNENAEAITGDVRVHAGTSTGDDADLTITQGNVLFLAVLMISGVLTADDN